MTLEGSPCIQVPLAHDGEFVIYFAGDAMKVDESVLQSARSLLQALGDLDNKVQEACAAECRKSGLHPRYFEGELAYITMSGGSALLHYFGIKVNSEWDERVKLESDEWRHVATTVE
ncbi:hypothetical protein OU994_13625 [Pseudoduganella sp. SL102]|uniref:hypothetical protein n=1 Tax=Pseudoduganella sp. SL102 TaxID=2995154 RepID=UPI00248A98E8|nr:hypothetical protein [Pseudoduganella sp. SL102]WBS05240.1 hypothetical protein OU994_13625 [Pseudoduganella sp. SL102]